MTRTVDYAHALDEHCRTNWGDPIDVSRWMKGRCHELPDSFRVLVLHRTEHIHAYATRCMSQPSDDGRLELHLLCRPTGSVQSDLVELLTAVAHYHRTGAALGLGHTVNFGRPWLSGSRCTYGLISLPYFDGPWLEWLPLARADH